jgi:hypothetical protein
LPHGYAIGALYADGAFWQQHPFRGAVECADQADRRRHRRPGRVSLLRFSDDGLALEERDFWNQR